MTRARSSRPCHDSGEEELDALAPARGRSPSSSARSASRSSSRSRSTRRRRGGEALDHVLLAGPPGLGKTSLAQIVRRELGVGIRQVAGPALERKGDIAAILTALEPRDVLFVDEIHRLNRAVEEILYPALEDFRLDIIVGQGPAARTLTLDLPPFTLIGATTRTGLLTTPLRDRFGMTFRLDLYTPRSSARSSAVSARILGVEIADDAADEIARRARGTPRIANRILRRVRDVAEVRHAGAITTDDRRARRSTCSRSTSVGLERFDRELLRAIVEKFGGGPVGLSTLAVALGEEAETIEDVYEPYLLQLGFLQRTPRGQDRDRARPRARRRGARGARRSSDAVRSRTVARGGVVIRRVSSDGCAPAAESVGAADCSCSAGCRPAGSCISAAAGAARAGPGSSRSPSRTRLRSPMRCGRRGPSGSTTTSRGLVFGPYYARGAAIVPVVPDVVVVFGASEGERRRRRRHACGGGARGGRGGRAAGPREGARRRARAARGGARGRLGRAAGPVEGAMLELAHSRRRGALVRARRRLPRRRRAARVAERGWSLAVLARSSSRPPSPGLERRGFPSCVQDAGVHRCPARSPTSAGSARTTCSS